MSHSMDIYSLVLLSVGLAMDAFSVALVAGFGLGKIKLSDTLKVSSVFGVAHIIMPTLGWFLGSTIIGLIQRWDHWIAFILLAFVGGKMIREGLDEENEELNACDLLNFTSLIMFTIAVSIDALAVGLSFSLQELSIWIPSLYMGAGTLIFTFIGLTIGNKTGSRFGKKAQIAGGLILILIGLRVVVTHIF
ncbi:MAG: manganese efflux pump MntP family protein [Candidatus Bathyarchaeota archaeon]|nr:manganese efflux pump MntP family protein [Candidatus Bathyarchaeota archaeon]